MRVSRSLSNKGFIINMLNACIGIGLLAKPYALSIAGYYSTISVLVALTLIIYSSILMAKVTMKAYAITDVNSYMLVNVTSDTDLTQTEDENNDSQRAIDDSQDAETKKHKSAFQIIGFASLGIYGEYYANCATLSVMTMISINIIIIEWQLLSGIMEYFLSLSLSSSSVPYYLNERFMFIYIFFAILPIVFVSKWRNLTFIGVISVISMIVLVVCMFVVFNISVSLFEDGRVPSHYFENKSFNDFIKYDSNNAAQFAIDRMDILERVLFAFLTFKSGISGSTLIPVLIIGLMDKRPSNIYRLITISYILVALFSVTFGVIGAVIYGSNVSVLILNNLFIWPSSFCVIIVCVITCVNLWSSYAIAISIVCDLLSGIMQIKQKQTTKILIVRLLVSLAIIAAAYSSRYHLAFMTATLSAVSAFGETLLLPLVLYIGMFYSQMSVVSKVFHTMLVAFGLLVGILVVYGTAKGLLM